MKKSRPEIPERLPIKLDAVSNGEYVPRPDARVQKLQENVMREASERARRLGVSRRAFSGQQLRCRDGLFWR